jgi:hypothetical protein
MKKIYTVLAVLILSSQIAFAQCPGYYSNTQINFTNIIVTNIVLTNDGGTPNDGTDDSYSANLEYDVTHNFGQYFWSYQFYYDNNLINGTMFGGHMVHPISIYGNLFSSYITDITLNLEYQLGLLPYTYICNTVYSVILPVAPLNIVSLNLNVTNDNNANHLKWNVENIQDVKSTTVEYSTDGSIFETLYQTNLPLSDYTHNQLLGNKHFYRIKFIDNQNQVNYSSLAKIETSISKSDFNVTNTIIQNELVLSAEQNKSITICDMQGVVLKKLELKAGTQSIDLHHLSSGIYLVKSNNQTIKVVKI